MAIMIKTASEIGAKWKTVTPLRTEEYKNGIEKPQRSWEKETLAAKERQKEGMQKALAEDRVAKGVQRAGQEKWSSKTALKGPSRWGEGVTISEQDFVAGYAPYRDVIEKIDLPARYSKGDPRNYERAKAVGLALHNKKIKG